MKKSEIKQVVEDLVTDECYDMMEEIEMKDLIKFMISVLPMAFKVKVERLKAGGSWKYQVKIKNDRESSFISVSDDEQTGVSRSVYYIFEDSENPTEDEIKTFLEMLNEAWYLCNN